MRRTAQLLASVKPVKYLEAGTPTGLTGVFTHAAPRSTLIYLYSTTLDKLKTHFPEDSMYRQSVEALTKHRLAIVSKAVPEGYEAWSAKAKKLIEENPNVFTTPVNGVSRDGGKHVKNVRDGKVFVTTRLEREVDDIVDEWDGERDEGPELEGSRSEAERQYALQKAFQNLPARDDPAKQVDWEPEPPLTADQIAGIENEIGAGLIEEVIDVAEGELKLVEVMAENKV